MKFMSEKSPADNASNTFERIKRVSRSGADFWSARELARVLEYTDFRNFTTVITKAREACANSGHTVSDHFVDTTEMVEIGSGAQRRYRQSQFCAMLGKGVATKKRRIINDCVS